MKEFNTICFDNVSQLYNTNLKKRIELLNYLVLLLILAAHLH